MTLANDFERLRDNRAAAFHLVRKAVNQWLDAPDDRQAHPFFVFGCQRSGTTMFIETLMAAPDLWVHPEKSQLAYDDFRLRSPATLSLITRLTPAAQAIYKPLCDSHLADRILDAHPDATGVWMVRRWEDVARSATAKWGDHHKDVVRAIASGRAADVGWRGERLPPVLIDQLGSLLDHTATAEDGATLFWYMRNSLYFSLHLQEHPRCRLVRYEDLVQRPEPTMRPIFEELGVGWDPAWVEGIVPTSVGAGGRDRVSPRIAAAADALQACFDDAALPAGGTPAW